MPISDDGPLFVIVHRSHSYNQPRDQVYDVRPDDSLEDVRERAAVLEAHAKTLYGRPKDTYRVAELHFVDEN